MKRKVYLDCTKLVRGTRWGKRMIPRLRQYCKSRFADFNPCMDDEDLFAFLYAKNTGSNMNAEFVRTRVNKDFLKWIVGDPAPEYLCSWLREALLDRLHYPIQRQQRPFAA